MTLAGMIAADENALICDLAETYGLFDYTTLPPHTAATLAVGLHDDSRIKMKINGDKVPINTLLLAELVDRGSLILGFLSNGKIKIPMISDDLLPDTKPQNKEPNAKVFDSPEAFEAYRARIIKEATQ